MPILERENANLYFEDTGSGEPMLLLHGFTVNANFWSETGLTSRLEGAFRVITPDLRGHGRSTVKAIPPGFNAYTLGEDVEALADQLGLDRFHLLGHSLGGIVAVRYAMRAGERLQSLTLLDASSATSLVPHYDVEARRRFTDAFANQFVGHGWDELLRSFRQRPGPLLSGLNQHPDGDEIWETYEDIVRINDPDALAVFARSFFWDPDFRREKLQRISCPTLVLVGANDTLFREPSEVMAQEIPLAKHVVLEDAGHMTLLEAPDRTLQEILDFLHDPSGQAPNQAADSTEPPSPEGPREPDET